AARGGSLTFANLDGPPDNFQETKMSHEPAEGKPVTIHASKNGSAWKWIAGAAAAAVLAGGGYYAWQNYGAAPSNTNVASNNAQFAQTSEAPIQAGPLPAQQADNNIASPDE